MPETSDRLQRRLVKRLRTHASKILEEITAPLAAPLVVPMGDEDHAVRIEVNPAGRAGAPEAADRVPGRMLSSTEQLVWHALAGGVWLVGKEIAARCGRGADDPRFKYLLLNLEDRGVLIHEDGRGYARAPQG